MCKIPAEAKQRTKEKKKGESLRNTHHMKCAANEEKTRRAFSLFYFLFMLLFCFLFFLLKEEKEKKKTKTFIYR